MLTIACIGNQCEGGGSSTTGELNKKAGDLIKEATGEVYTPGRIRGFLTNGFEGLTGQHKTKFDQLRADNVARKNFESAPNKILRK